jgi:hypothetical protein
MASGLLFCAPNLAWFASTDPDSALCAAGRLWQGLELPAILLALAWTAPTKASLPKAT